MGFVSGVIAGVAASAAAAAWYMSRSGERYRDQYRVERRLGDIGDQLESRTREIQSSVNAQLADMRSSNGALDSVKASAAEAAAAVEAAGADLTSRRTRTPKDPSVE